ncbi:hypothetical protein [Plantactinospora sp. B5E13]|uniref:hypothetical protein n=1 Tax=unclassified Plantactinospora TaxID=2631981 RepID=UPI00325E416B
MSVYRLPPPPRSAGRQPVRARLPQVRAALDNPLRAALDNPLRAALGNRPGPPTGP